jgi:rhomboid family GlyGly-CTERM serine protease
MLIEQPMNRPSTQWLRYRIPWLVLAALLILLQFVGAEQVLRFDRTAIEAGQWWRLLSAHLVHLNWNHLWLNLGGLLLVAIFFSAYCSLRQWLALLLFCALGTGLALYLYDDRLMYYVGLSGVLHGLFLMGAWRESRHYPLAGYSLLILLVAKLLWEQLQGPLPGSESMTGGRVAVNAHLFGALSAALFILLHQVVHIHDWQQNRQHDGQHHHTHDDD